jgi:hypothetical protein
VKRGLPDALRLLGYGQKVSVAIDDVRIAPRRVAIGGRVGVEFVLRSRSGAAQDLLVDLVVHFIKANGRPAPKVFKLRRVALPARGRAAFSTSVSLAVHTTRKPQAGLHVVDVIVNGTAMPLGTFQVVRAKP